MQAKAAARALPALDWETAEQHGFPKSLIHAKRAPAPVRCIRGLTQKEVKEFVDGERRRCGVGFQIEGKKGGPLDSDSKKSRGAEKTEQDRPFEEGFFRCGNYGSGEAVPEEKRLRGQGNRVVQGVGCPARFTACRTDKDSYMIKYICEDHSEACRIMCAGGALRRSRQANEMLRCAVQPVLPGDAHRRASPRPPASPLRCMSHGSARTVARLRARP